METITVSNIDKDKLIIVQENRLIEASYQITLQQKKLLLIMVGKIRQEDIDFQEYVFSVADLQRELGLENKRFYEDLKNLTAGLIGKVIRIRDDSGIEIQAAWLSSAVYLPRGTRGLDCSCVKLSFAPVLKPYLLQLQKCFGKYEFSQVVGMRSVYAIRMYELLNSYRRLRKAVFEVDELKRMFKIEKKYERYFDFRVWVIEAAQKELAEKTNLAFDFEETKRGRTVVSITFNIYDNKPIKQLDSTISDLAKIKTKAGIEVRQSEDCQQPRLLPPTEAEQEHEKLYHEAIAEGVKNGVNEYRMRDLLSTRNPAHVIENIDIARKRLMSTKGENVNIAGLTVSAITEDYAKDERDKQQKAKAAVSKRDQKKRANEIINRIESVAHIARLDEIKDRMGGLPEAELGVLRSEFEGEIEAGEHGDYLTKAFHARGWKAAGIEPIFRGFAASRLGIGTEEDFRRAHAEELGHNWEALKAQVGK